jgi:hypothetical protein
MHGTNIEENIITNRLFQWIARFYILKRVLLSIQMFWGCDSVSLVERYQMFRKTLQRFNTPTAKCFTSEYNEATCLQTIGDYSPKSHYKTLENNFSIPR